MSRNDDNTEELLKAFDSEVQIEDLFADNWFDNSDSIDSDIRSRSEDAYISIANDIVQASIKQLNNQNTSKNLLKKIFTIFFIAFISTQYVILIVLLFFKGCCTSFSLSDSVINTYITSLFVETLSAIIVMIKYAFNSDQENRIIEILNSVISEYQKYKDESNKASKDSG